MPITTDFKVFEQNYKKDKIKSFWISTSPLQNFKTPSSPIISPPISIPSPMSTSSQKPLIEEFNPFCYFSRVSIEQLQVGDIVKYNHKSKENICKVIKISSSKKSFKKIDGTLSYSGIFTESGISNIIDKDTIGCSRKIFKMHNFKKNVWRKNLLYLINIHFTKSQIFTTDEIYEKCKDILTLVYPKSNTIRASIRANLQSLRDEKYIKFISLGKYILL